MIVVWIRQQRLVGLDDRLGITGEVYVG